MKYKKEGTQQLQQVQLYTQRATTHRIRTVEGTIGTNQELKTSSIQIGKTSPKTLSHLSYQWMSKAI
jgi:hypothetical protein